MRGTPEVSVWQPIASAPKDGTRIIVYRPRFDGDYIPQIGCDYWMQSKWISGAWAHSNSDCPPTHWVPLPEPPK